MNRLALLLKILIHIRNLLVKQVQNIVKLGVGIIRLARPVVHFKHFDKRLQSANFQINFVVLLRAANDQRQVVEYFSNCLLILFALNFIEVRAIS